MTSPPPIGTVEHWCHALLHTTVLAEKLQPAPPPAPLDERSWEARAPARRHTGASRPPELRAADRGRRSVGSRSLVQVEARARLVHTFLHHELQAAELFAAHLAAIGGAGAV